MTFVILQCTSWGTKWIMGNSHNSFFSQIFLNLLLTSPGTDDPTLIEIAERKELTLFQVNSQGSIVDGKIV